MTQPNGAAAPQPAETNSGFFVNTGTHTGWFTTPDGDIYDIRKLEPREVTDPRNGEVTTIWGGYATARDRDLAARDAILQAEFKKTGVRPAELFDPQARDIPLYITLRNRPGKGYSDIGSFWNARGRYTIFARDLEGKRGLRFGGNVLAWKSTAALDAERAAQTPEPDVAAPDAAPVSAPDGKAARDGAAKRARKGRDDTPSADA
ncbi:MAG: hypothetical protein K2X41_04525 [Hyphomicrobium sp.]|nr:hypothetical protein [Hyphomicrobium sp.]